MTHKITIKIDKRPVTLTEGDVQSLVRIARDIDRVAFRKSLAEYDCVHKTQMQRLGDWLDTHGPEGGVQ